MVFLSGVRAGAVVPVNHTLTAGRSQDCDLEVPDPVASRHHATFEFDGRDLVVVDHKSANGTFVNEERITKHGLSHGDIARIGETRIRIQRRGKGASRGSDSSRNPLSSVFDLKEGEEDSIDSSLSLSMVESRISTAGKSAEELSRRLTAVLTVSESLARIRELDEIFDSILDVLFDVFGQAERGFLLLGSQFDELEPKAVRYRRGKARTDSIEISGSLCRAAIDRKSVLVYSDQHSGDFEEGMSLVSLNIRSAMAVPLLAEEEILGLLVIDTQDSRRPFTNDDMELAAAVCRQVAAALKNTMLLQQVQDEVSTRRNLARFLPKPVVDQAVEGSLDLALGGSDYKGTVFYCDLVGFTSMAESMKPQEVIGHMNTFFNHMVPCIETAGGAIDKFMGDNIMAFWGIPFDKGDAARNAITAGLVMQTTLFGLNTVFEREKRPLLKMAVGMHTGEVVAGNIGSEDRLEYTVLGNTVNTASRIENLACREQILVSVTTWDDADCRVFGVRLSPITVKNKRDPVEIYSVRAVEEEGGEIQMFLPVLFDEHRGTIVRRISSGDFILLHPPSFEAEEVAVRTAVVEWPDVELGTATVQARLPAQAGDGNLRRSIIAFEDRTAGGLLGDAPVECTLDWEQMARSSYA